MSLDKVSLTLYDFLGYILPGYVSLFACSILEATFFVSPMFSISNINNNLIFSIIIAYYLGHVSHRIGSWIKAWKYGWFDNKKWRLSEILYRHTKNSLLELYELKLEKDQKVPFLETYMLADSYLVACGQTSERDSLMAREGFHKASMVSFGLMALSLLLTLGKGGAKIQSQPGTYFDLYVAATLASALFSIGIALLFRTGFVFYNRLKINNTLLISIALQKANVEEEEEKESE